MDLWLGSIRGQVQIINEDLYKLLAKWYLWISRIPVASSILLVKIYAASQGTLLGIMLKDLGKQAQRHRLESWCSNFVQSIPKFRSIDTTPPTNPSHQDHRWAMALLYI